MALGGWRIGFARLPESAAGAATRERVLGIASEVWSSLAAPMQAVAADVLREPPDVAAHIACSRELHRAATTAVYEGLRAVGVECRPPSGGFYLYPDLELLRPHAETGAELAELLLERFGIAVLAGAAFGDDPSALRIRLATSLLHGDTEAERARALAAPDAAVLPGVRRAVDVLTAAIDDLIGV
jgi:aspartate aminotransferase